MVEIALQVPVPLAADADGVVRVGNTRVTLDTVVAAIEAGYGCEDIAEQYPSLRLSDIYVVASYYLTHRDELLPYLQQRGSEEAQARATSHLTPGETNREIRERLLKRRQSAGESQ